MTVVIVVALLLLWNLEFAATLLNLRAFPPKVPDELADLMDADQPVGLHAHRVADVLVCRRLRLA
ncbi:MAG: hypothetical protein MUC40_07465 [Akkermansiaceae bacterium]|nr:hypothetical protein [Akkermansiaceae bacterium]